MKYKVGDKVRVRKDLNIDKMYGFLYATDEMLKKKIVTIKSVHDGYYGIKEDVFMWTDGMLEGLVEDELTAEETIRLKCEMCESISCSECKFSKHNNGEDIFCNKFLKKYPEQVVEILKQWKKDVEVEFAWYAVIKDEKGSIVHEERIESPLGSNKEYLENNKEILAKYCSEHNGKFYGLTERRCVVKE